MIRKDITGKIYANLKVIGWLKYVYVGVTKKSRSLYLCKCSCGRYRHVVQGDLTSGKVVSCGCLNKHGRLRHVKTLTTKVCPICGLTKLLEHFSKNAAYCRPCYSNYNKSRYNPQLQSVKAKVSYIKNKDKRLAYYRKYKQNNPQKVKMTLANWKKKNPNYKKLKWKQDLNFRIKENLRGRLYKAVMGLSKSGSTLDLLSCSVEELKTYISKLFKSGMSWDNYGQWHIDHIKPCASFDLTKTEEQKKCFHYSNLQPLWAIDNLTKSNKWEVLN